MEIDIRSITTNEALFQNRVSLNADHVSRIAANIDIKVLQANPVTLYKHEGKNIILSGHHRFAACQQAGIKHIPATFFNGTLLEAQKFALDSNAGNLQETFFERAKKYRMLLKTLSVNEVFAEIKKVHTKDALQILEFSLLPENSIPIQELKMFHNAGCSTDNNIILDCCQWTGAICRAKQINTEQVNEIYRFAKESYIKLKEGRRLFNKNTFFDYVTSILDRAGRNTFVSFKDKGDSEVKKNFDALVRELQEQIKQAEKNLNDKRTEVMFAELSPEQISKVLQNSEIAVIVLKKQLSELNGKKDQILNAEKQQTDIFSMMQHEEQPPEIEIMEAPEDIIQWNIPQQNIIINQNPKTNMETTKSESELQENHDKMLNKHIAEYNDKKAERQRNRERESSEAKVEVIKYSERAIALKGEGTKQIKDQLKALGGKFNRYLKSENGIFAGWIFSVKKLNEVTELLKMKGV